MKVPAIPRGIIRKARLSDAHAIAAVHVSVSRETYADLIPAATRDQFAVESRVRQWHEMINEPGSSDIAAFVAEDAADRRILGFGSCSRQRSEMLVGKGLNGEFQTIYILPPAQGCGIGRALMAEMARHLNDLRISGAALGIC
jgi:ribosomal protein S18 acetylase RimI-like enzyme